MPQPGQNYLYLVPHPQKGNVNGQAAGNLLSGIGGALAGAPKLKGKSSQVGPDGNLTDPGQYQASFMQNLFSGGRAGMEAMQANAELMRTRMDNTNRLAVQNLQNTGSMNVEDLRSKTEKYVTDTNAQAEINLAVKNGEISKAQTILAHQLAMEGKAVDTGGEIAKGNAKVINDAGGVANIDTNNLTQSQTPNNNLPLTNALNSTAATNAQTKQQVASAMTGPRGPAVGEASAGAQANTAKLLSEAAYSPFRFDANGSSVSSIAPNGSLNVHPIMNPMMAAAMGVGGGGGGLNLPVTTIPGQPNFSSMRLGNPAAATTSTPEGTGATNSTPAPNPAAPLTSPGPSPSPQVYGPPGPSSTAMTLSNLGIPFNVQANILNWLKASPSTGPDPDTQNISGLNIRAGDLQ